MAILLNAELLRAVVDSLHTAVCVLDCQGKVALWSQAAARLTGYTEAELIGRGAREIILPHSVERSHANADGAHGLARMGQEGRPAVAKMYLRHRRGHSVPVLVHLAPIRETHGAMLAIAASFETQLTRNQEERSQQSVVPPTGLDVATGIANHRFTEFRLRENLEAFREYHVPFGIVRVRAMGLDRIRATYSREARDMILLVMAQTLSNSLRPNDFVGRWGEDEFLAILMNCGPQAVHAICQRMQRPVAAVEIRWWGKTLRVRSEIGCAAVESLDTLESLLQRARDQWSSQSADGAASVAEGVPPQVRS
jgi:PAS domain S-box-containing protein/diguanylate cyclase (GGDEF)-like protein